MKVLEGAEENFPEGESREEKRCGREIEGKEFFQKRVAGRIEIVCGKRGRKAQETSERS